MDMANFKACRINTWDADSIKQRSQSIYAYFGHLSYPTKTLQAYISLGKLHCYVLATSKKRQKKKTQILGGKPSKIPKLSILKEEERALETL